MNKKLETTLSNLESAEKVIRGLFITPQNFAYIDLYKSLQLLALAGEYDLVDKTCGVIVETLGKKD